MSIVFSSLPPQVTRALFEDTTVVPELYAINECAIFFVFQFLREWFEDTEAGEDQFGQLVLDAVAASQAMDPPEDNCEDKEDSWPVMGVCGVLLWCTYVGFTARDADLYWVCGVLLWCTCRITDKELACTGCVVVGLSVHIRVIRGR